MRDIIPISDRPLAAPAVKKSRTSRPGRAKSGFTFKRPPASSRLKLIVIGVFLYAAAVVSLGIFARAQVSVVLKSEPLNINAIFPASSSSADSFGSSGILAEKVVFDSTAESSAKTETIRSFSERASGVIVIYNSYSSEPQPLVAKTRFETPDGKTYKIDRGLTVPGAKIIDGKIEPSSIEAQVYAAEPGEAYNNGLTDFTIPGFKGSSKYEKFYARSKTEMKGGFTGEARVVSEKDAEGMREALEEKLKNELHLKMTSELPDEFLVPENAYEFDIKMTSIEPAIGERADEFRIALIGKLKAFFVRKEDIKTKILEHFRGDPYFGSIDIPNFDGLEISALNPDFEELALDMKISGSADAVWSVENKQFAEELALVAGYAERIEVFERYPQIRQAEITYSPSWWRIFPDRADKVIINASY